MGGRKAGAFLRLAGQNGSRNFSSSGKVPFRDGSLSPRSPIIFFIGPLNGFFPVVTKTTYPSSRPYRSWVSPMPEAGSPRLDISGHDAVVIRIGAAGEAGE